MKHPNIDVKVPHVRHGTPLVHAVDVNNLRIVHKLLRHPNIDVNIKEPFGETALYMASHAGRAALVRELLNNEKVDVNRTAKNGLTPLHAAICQGHIVVVRDLLKCNKVDVNVANDYGDTALVVAIAVLNVATKDGVKWDLVGEIITQKNVDLNIRGRLGYTLLMWATLEGNFDMVSRLLQHDTLDTNLKNIVGSTALDIAHNCGHVALAELLRDTKLIHHGIDTIQHDASPTKRMKKTDIP